MPEGDTIFRAARTLHRALAGRKVTRFESVLPYLSRKEIDSGVSGRTIERVEARGKWLLLHFSGGLTLLTHMLMSGSWHIYRPGESWQKKTVDMRIVIETDAFVAVAFNVPVAEFHDAKSLERRRVFRNLGMDVLGGEWNEAEAIARLRARPELEVGPALLDQSILTGIGNVFKSEVCFGSGVNPFRRVATLSEEELKKLAATARKFLLANVTESSGDEIKTYFRMRTTTGRANPTDRLWVYQRTGEPCRNCGTAIVSQKQMPDARSTFWCPQCQPLDAQAARQAS